MQAEGIASYKLFISTLLDITDNYAPDGKIIPPDCVVRHEGDDPYFVVAADKGTATFSDIANQISVEHDYWLGDAFASGGSAGYDHKAMGITARGAWEAVKRHFREMDVNIGTTPFTVVGVGDMSGDVFGNGMLRETTIRLVAAFDHRDIFIDPDPDPAASFNERKRMFALPRSSWQDYDKTLISKGGGVYPRSSKEIRLSPEAQKLLGVGESVTPQQLMKAILKAQVDLLFFGGIGTYVRAASETDDAAGDRANDAIRITGADLRCKVVGEGANLGMTQRGRVEAALNGVRLNTDAIDNSAGVNTSDVEVNIKIALSPLVRSGALTMEARNALLVEMTDEVARLVLRNNYQQTLALSLAQRRGLEDLGFQQRLMQTLETRGELDRAVEFLPDEMALADRRKRNAPLTRPELSVLLAYAKLSLYNELLASTVPDDPYLSRELERYFPKEMSERYDEALHAHRLRREIIATQLTNSMINRGGATLIVRIADQTGALPAAIAAAFAAVRQSYDMVALNTEIDGLDNKVSGKVQLDLYATVQDLLLDRIVWALRNVDAKQGLEKGIAHYRDGIAQVAAALDATLPKPAAAARDARLAELVRAGVPEALARRLANLAAAQGRARYRPGRRPHQETGSRGDRDLFRRRGLLPARPGGECGARHRGVGLFRPAGARPRRRFDWRRRAALDRGHGRQWPGKRTCRRRRGGRVGQAAPGRSRAHPLGDPRNRRLGADAVEAVGGGEFARGFGEGVDRQPEARAKRASKDDSPGRSSFEGRGARPPLDDGLMPKMPHAR